MNSLPIIKQGCINTLEEKAEDVPAVTAHEKWKGETLASLDQLDSRNASEITIWGTETIKHVALISLAGLAGVFAVVGGGHAIASGMWAAGILFAGSSFLSTLSMYLAHLGRLNLSGRIQETREKIVNGTYRSASDWVDDTVCERFIFVGNGFGILAAILVVAGGICLFYSMPVAGT